MATTVSTSLFLGEEPCGPRDRQLPENIPAVTHPQSGKSGCSKPGLDVGSKPDEGASVNGNVPLLTHPPEREELRVGRREQQAIVARLRHPRKTQHQPTTDAASTDQAPGRPPSTSCATPRCSLRPPARTPGASCRVFWTMTKAHRACCRRQPVATCHC